jgi:superfamily II DNA helicase RecQ
LEPVLKERLSIDNAVVFRRSTARRTIRYQVIDSREEPPSVVGTKFVQQLSLPRGKRGVVYVRSYTTGTIISTALQCPFYKACADDKGALLQEWVQGPGGWIVATSALGTGINIEGIVYIVHVDRPYGLTSFAQQSGRGGRNREVSNSVIITRVGNSYRQKRSSIISKYSVEQIDEDAMTEFIQARTCRRQVLSRYFDQGVGRTDCHSTDSMFCNQCKTSNRPREAGINTGFHRTVGRKEGAQEEEGIQADTDEGKGVEVIARRLSILQESYESMIAVMDRLQGGYIYCQLIIKGGRETGEGIPQESGCQAQLHTYNDCPEAEADRCGFAAYQQ